MAKIRSLLELSVTLDREISWRTHELSEIKKIISLKTGSTQNAVIRSSVPIAYAHWEGFVKAASVAYGTYVSSKGLTFAQVEPCFQGIAAIDSVRTIGTIKKRVFASSEAICALQELNSEPCTVKLGSHISHVGNLNFDVFNQISSLLGINSSWYSTRKNLIDEQLLMARNKIAHGEYLEIDALGAIELGVQVNILMRRYKDDIENAAELEEYIRS